MTLLLLSCLSGEPPPGDPPGPPGPPGSPDKNQGPTSQYPPGSKIVVWGQGENPESIYTELESGKSLGKRAGIVIPGAGLWALSPGVTTWTCTCDPAACTTPDRDARELFTGKETTLLTPKGFASATQRLSVHGSVGSLVFVSAEQKGTDCTNTPQQTHIEAVIDLRTQQQVSLFAEEEQSLSSTARSWVAREFLLNPAVPMAGDVRLAWSRPDFQATSLRLLQCYYADSLPGKGDGMVGGDTMAVEYPIDRLPRLLLPWASVPPAISAVARHPGGWGIAEGDVGRWFLD